jgi:DNA-binding MarR family transcriptional regulator
MITDQPPITREEIEELRQENTGRLLLRAYRDFSERAMVKLSQRGHLSLGLAHTNLLANLDTAGTRLTTLAERLAVSKQAIGSLVGELEAAGYVRRTVDPADRRAALVTFTEAGWGFLNDAYYVKREIEAEYRAILGEDGLETVRSLLSKLLAGEQKPGDTL